MFSKMLQAEVNADSAEIESQKTAMVSTLKSNGVMFRKSVAATSSATEG